MKVTNISAGPRGLNTKTGTVILEPGEERDDLELSKEELGVSKGTGWFSFGDAEKAAAPETDDKSKSPAGGSDTGKSDGKKA